MRSNKKRDYPPTADQSHHFRTGQTPRASMLTDPRQSRRLLPNLELLYNRTCVLVNANRRENKSCRAAAVLAWLVEKPRRVSPWSGEINQDPFSAATCAWLKILLGLQTCEMAVSRGHFVRCGKPQNRRKGYAFSTHPRPPAFTVGGRFLM